MFPTMCTTTSSLSGPARAGDRPTMPARSPSVGGIPSRAIGLPWIMIALWELALQAVWAQTLITLLLNLQAYPWIKSPLHFYGTSGLLLLINVFLSHLLTPTTRTLPPCRQRCSTLLIIQILLRPLTGPDNPVLCHYFCYYLKCVYDNEMFTIGDTLTCSNGGQREEINDLHSFRAIRG